jgi:hypothetical protein
MQKYIAMRDIVGNGQVGILRHSDVSVSNHRMSGYEISCQSSCRTVDVSTCSIMPGESEATKTNAIGMLFGEFPCTTLAKRGGN